MMPVGHISRACRKWRCYVILDSGLHMHGRSSLFFHVEPLVHGSDVERFPCLQYTHCSPHP
jgi:hypothetical protein